MSIARRRDNSQSYGKMIRFFHRVFLSLNSASNYVISMLRKRLLCASKNFLLTYLTDNSARQFHMSNTVDGSISAMNT